MNDEQKIKMLNKFAKDFAKFMNKYPDVTVMGDRDGDVMGYVGLQLPSTKNNYDTATIINNYGSIRLTHMGKVIQ